MGPLRASIVIPARDEGTRIAATLEATSHWPEVIDRLVVDDGSRDDTEIAARRAGARVIRLASPVGKGWAVARGLSEAMGDVALLLDADLGETAGRARALLEPVMTGRADLTIAAFPVRPGRGGGFGLVKRLAGWGVHRLTGVALREPLSGQRAVRLALLRRLHLDPGWGLEVGMVVDALRLGWRVEEMDIELDHRVTGRSAADMLHRARQLADVGLSLMRRSRTPRSTPLPRGDGGW